MKMPYYLNNVCNTNQSSGKDNSIWLMRASYTKTEIARKLLDLFMLIFCQCFKNVTNVTVPPATPEEDQLWNQHWVKKIRLNAVMKNFLPSWITHVKELEKAQKHTSSKLESRA